MPIKLNGSGSGSVALNAPANTSGGSDISFTLPTADGTSGQVLQTNGSGALSFASASSDNITEGNTTAEVVDTGSDGHFKVTTEGTEALRVDSSRRLLVGTNTARSTFFNSTFGTSIQVEGAGASDRGISAISSSTETARGGQVILGHQKSGAVGGNTAVSSGDQIGIISFQGNDGAEFVEAARIETIVDTTPGSNNMPGRLVFSTTSSSASSPTARMFIDRSGGLYPSTDNVSLLGDSTKRWTAVYAVNGTIQTSDEREKTDIASASLGIDFVKQLRPVSYKFKVGENILSKAEDGITDVVTPRPGERTHWGFIAQEVKQAVDAAGVDFGGWILTDKDDPDSTQGLRYDQFIAPLTKALQEALAKLETLEAANAALEARLTALEGGAS